MLLLLLLLLLQHQQYREVMLNPACIID